jgi:acyl-CoA reductase-like NAD-dependent aldehyde dehydrogenase
MITPDAFPDRPGVAWKWRPSKGKSTRPLIDPATGDPCGTVYDASVNDLEKAVSAAESAFQGWRKLTPGQRSGALNLLAREIEVLVETIAWADCWSMGKPIRSARGEANYGAAGFRYYAGAVAHAAGQTLPVAKGGFDFTMRVPFGVVGLITPWNFPFPITCWKTAAALAAGNCVIIKPASNTPWSALLLARAAEAAGLPPGVVQVLPGPGKELGEALTLHPRIRKVSFTGSTEVGRRIMELAARDITRVSLELGGKSPNVIFADADIARAAAESPMSVFDNTGQDCCARSRILVEARAAKAFTAGFVTATRKIKVGDPKQESTDLGPLANRSQFETTVRYVEAARQAGRRIVTGGRRIGNKGFYYEPTLIEGCKPDDAWWNEEIFGPVACLRTFRNEEEALAGANDSIFGLSGSLWTRDLDRTLRMAADLETGVLSVNTHSSVHLEAPFGGMKQSGCGRELGMAGLEAFSELRNIYIAKP